MDIEQSNAFNEHASNNSALSNNHSVGSSTQDSSRIYGIQEVVELTGISAFTIRYYDKLGFFPNILRGKRGVRSFRQGDIDQLKLVDSLRKSGLSIEGISYYVRLEKKGVATIDERKMIVQNQTTALEYQIEEMRESLQFLKSVQNLLDNDN